MLNNDIKLILGTINLYGNSNLNQTVIDEGFQKLKQAKELLSAGNKEPSSNLKDEYDKQYNIHKNDNVAALELPYVNREFYEHTFLPDEDVIIGFYVDDSEESYYRSEIKSVYKLVMYDNHEVIKVDYIHPGSQQMNFGKLAEGEHILSYEVQDIYGRKSFRDYFEIRVKTPTIKSEYIIADSEIPSNSDSIGWLNQLILDLDESYNYLTLPTGTYKMKFGETLILKDNLTLNLNGSEIILEEGQAGDKNLQVNIKQCYDAHVINGAIVGDRVTHDYENSPNNSEWVHGICLEGRSKYSSYENIEVRDMTGYGSLVGYACDRNQNFHDYRWAYISFGKNWNKDIKRTESDFIDLTNFKVEGCEFIQVGLYLGYQGCPGNTWYFEIEMYNENKELVDNFNGYFYRRIYIPKEVKYCKIYSLVGAGGMYSNTEIFAFKTPVNCEFKNVRHIDCRCVGSSPSAMESFRLIDCYFTRCGSNAAKCAFDSEDGWDMMHDFYMTRTVFENNYLNDWLTCAGHNFLLENNEYNGNMHFWTRCQNYTVRNNKIKNIQEGTSRDTHHVRIYDNECSNMIYTTKTIIKNCKVKYINGEAKDCISTGLPCSAQTVDNCNFILSNETQCINGISVSNSSFSLAEGVTSRDFSFNKRDAINKFVNCDFRGGRYSLINHNIFNSGEFINCNFDKVKIEVSCQYDDNTKTIVFKNCVLPIDGYLIKLAPYVYTKGIINVIFENCIITDSGEFKLQHNLGSALIVVFSQPMEGSSITFRNCTINKPTGALLESYNSTWKLNLILENTPLSDNLQITDKAKECVNLIIK